MAAAKEVLEGRRQAFTEGDDDPFEGLTPKQIQEIVETQRGALEQQRDSDRRAQRESRAADDPFDVRGCVELVQLDPAAVGALQCWCLLARRCRSIQCALHDFTAK